MREVLNIKVTVSEIAASLEKMGYVVFPKDIMDKYVRERDAFLKEREEFLKEKAS